MHQKITIINGIRKEEKTEYLLHERALLMKEYLEIKEVCSPLWSLEYFTYKKEVPKGKASRTSLMSGELKSQKRRASNSNLFPLFIEFGILKKNEIRYDLELVLISKKSKKIGFITIRRSLGLQECQMALMGVELAFEFWSNLDSLFEDFWARNFTLIHF